jgi:hypothetical protein
MNRQLRWNQIDTRLTGTAAIALIVLRGELTFHEVVRNLFHRGRMSMRWVTKAFPEPQHFFKSRDELMYAERRLATASVQVSSNYEQVWVKVA